MNNGHDRDRALRALHRLDPGGSREDWHRKGCAAIAAGLLVDDIVNWSSTAANYKGEKDVRAAFRSITPEGGIGPGSLFYLARAEGWQDTPGQPKQQRHSKAPSRPVAAPKPPRPGLTAVEVWARMKPAPADHAYIVAKQGMPDGLRVVPDGDPLRIATTSVAGWLVVPVLPWAGGEPLSLQFIPPPGQGKKLNLPAAPMAGVFVVGDLTPGSTAHLCEGIGQAWACWKATGAAAVVCFGWGRVRGVAAELRERDPSARLVLVPDVGKEADAERIAAEVGAAVARMPEGWPVNADVNDLAQRDGHDALEALLGGAAEPPKPEPVLHPLAQYVDLNAEPMAPRVVIPGFVGYGLVIVAGAHGGGKTSTLLPLSMVAAGLHRQGDPLAPKHWRHVVYITEDTEQALRIVAGIVKFGGLGLNADTVRERLHIVEARRLEPAYVTEVATTYREQFARIVDGVEVPPLVVMDTKSAVFSIADENSNSEASAIVAMLKQSFQSLPVWLVGHVAKANITRADVAGLTLRGASAFEADANQVLYLVKEGEARYLVRGKTRFEAEWTELQIGSKTAAMMARDEFGDMQLVTLRWGIAAPPEQTRKEAQEQAQEAQRKADAAALRDEVREVIDVAWQTGCPLNRAGVKAKVKRRGAEVLACIESLLAERWLLEMEVPAKDRTNANRARFLVGLTPHEHDAVVRGEGWPAAKLVVPESWRKPAAPSVPEVAPQEEQEVAHATTE